MTLRDTEFKRFENLNISKTKQESESNDNNNWETDFFVVGAL